MWRKCFGYLPKILWSSVTLSLGLLGGPWGLESPKLGRLIYDHSLPGLSGTNLGPLNFRFTPSIVWAARVSCVLYRPLCPGPHLRSAPLGSSELTVSSWCALSFQAQGREQGE